ncbi:MAG TPA: TPM domain-containing protein [Verrucomicrobiota bacterium]|nr:TPM domain-containing protein [Verrucomicrobiota bacterium]HNT15318.1 TPM domain-containing protein [Verrucomicrobiota bacterium]
MRRALLLLALLFGVAGLVAEVVPPAPQRYFNDYAQVVPPEIAEQLNRTLEDFERETSDQIVVAIFPEMQSDSSVEDYTVRVARAWQVGQQDRNNGAVLFVFLRDRKLYIQVGYGLEGRLPDALCKRIIETEIKPRFKADDYSGGLTAGVRSLLQAARGEYRGTGRTVADSTGRPHSSGIPPWFSLIFMMGIASCVVVAAMRRRFQRRGRGWIISSSGGGWSGGGGSFGGGGFSGGGGSFGGGGAGGSW